MLQALQADVSGVMPQALATGLFVSLCTLQQPSGTLSPDGSPDNTFANVSGMVNIPCMASVLREGTILAGEVKQLQEIMAAAFRHITLNGYYPQCLPGPGKGWRVILDGITYDLLGAEADSQKTQTRLKVQLVTL